MISELTKILDRDFVIGYFLPSTLFVSASLMLVSIFFPQSSTYLALLTDSSLNYSSVSNTNFTVETPNVIEILNLLQHFWTIALSLLIVLTLGILLVALNRPLIRFLEGYDLLERTPLRTRQLKIYRNLEKQRKEIDDQIKVEEKNKRQATPESIGKQIETHLKLATFFPPESYILPTSFGNVIRAFETYSSIVYGLDAIPVWSRLILLIPNDQREIINGQKSQVDFAINIFYLTILVIIEYIIFAYLNRSLIFAWIPLAGLIIIYLAYKYAIASAISWGENVKAIFDLYRYELLIKMGLEIPETWKEEYDLCTQISQSFLYRSEFKAERSKHDKD